MGQLESEKRPPRYEFMTHHHVWHGMGESASTWTRSTVTLLDAGGKLAKHQAQTTNQVSKVMEPCVEGDVLARLSVPTYILHSSTYVHSTCMGDGEVQPRQRGDGIQMDMRQHDLATTRDDSGTVAIQVDFPSENNVLPARFPVTELP